MEGSKDISFNEFIKDEAIKPEPIPEISLSLESAVEKQVPLMPETGQADEAQLTDFWQKLRDYFHNAKPLTQPANKANLVPAFINQLQQQESISSSFPVFLSSESENACVPLHQLIQDCFHTVFEQGEATILQSYLPRLEFIIRRSLGESSGNKPSADVIFEAAINELSKVEIHGEEKKHFEENLVRLASALPSQGVLLDINPDLPFQFLEIVLQQTWQQKKQAFLRHIHSLEHALNNLLLIEKEKATDSEGISHLKKDYDFADDIIDFGRFKGIIPKGGSQPMPTDRRNRIGTILQSLAEAGTWIENLKPAIIPGLDILKKFPSTWEKLLPGSNLHKGFKGSVCNYAESIFSEYTKSISKAVEAVRKAQLEADNNYQEAIHDKYFQNFDWQHATKDELLAVAPIIIIEDASALAAEQSPHLARIIAANYVVKCIALTGISTEKHDNGLETYYGSPGDELFATCLSHRNAFIFQSGTDDPMYLLNGLKEGMNTPATALWHIHIGALNDANSQKQYLDISAATESRKFPRAKYNPERNAKWGSRFDISFNPQAQLNWPEYEFSYRQGDSSQSMACPFTYADYWAMTPVQAQRMLPVPPEFWTENLLPLHQYLQLEGTELYDKIPFIWMVNADNELVKAAIPFSLVEQCMQYLEFWNFLQELSGVNSYHVEQAIKTTAAEKQKEKEAEIEQLIVQHQEELETMLSHAESDTMERLASMLLGLSPDTIEIIPQEKSISTETKKKEENTQQPGDEKQPQNQAEADEPLISQEPWIGTSLCTSCNECTERYPSAFNYNSDKQAVFTDYTSISFAQLVDAAENCPAKCIHPGQPTNPNESGLEDLIKRAAVFG